MSGAPLSALHLVSAGELQELRAELEEGRVPLDLQDKLAALVGRDALHHFIGHNGLLIASLLLAAEDGAFHGCTREELEYLLRVLAYVRKEDDAIPDHRTDGFADDHQEVRLAMQSLERVLREFKEWRLQHQVPRLWRLAQRKRM